MTIRITIGITSAPRMSVVFVIVMVILIVLGRSLHWGTTDKEYDNHHEHNTQHTRGASPAV